MSDDHTELQFGDDEHQARELSLRHTRPPTQVPGYHLTRFLGSGAFGEVWIGLDRNTGRQIAVKFYQHQGGVDWSLLSREVEKLVLLSADRYVVQVLDVGWQADPPYYVMEYIENGSLERLSQRDDSQTIEQVVELFREIATGLNHSHAKGILHCDLKPGNVLLDQDNQPRLADFGQSRLSNEQTPSLGTLFYMAPEQASLEAVPDASWDVYALGALFYYLLVGKPPHYSDDVLKQIEEASHLTSRLRVYRQWITTNKPPDEHRRVPGVDRVLAGIIDQCLHPNPKKRFPNVQSVLDTLHARDQARARRPLLLLGVLGPLLLLALMWFFGGRAADEALQKTRVAVEERVSQSSRFAAKFVAASVAAKIDRYYRAIEGTAQNAELRDAISRVVHQLEPDLIELADPGQDAEDKERRKQEFLENPVREALQREVDTLYEQEIGPLENRSPPEIVSLFVCGPRGTHLAGAFPSGSKVTVGDNFAFRSYCHGGLRDLEDRDARPLPERHVERTSLSSPLLSKVNQRWKIAVSTPLFQPDAPDELLAVLVLTVEVGEIVGDLLNFDADNKLDSGKPDQRMPGYFPRFAVLVDNRENNYQGMVLDHPMFREVELGQRDQLDDADDADDAVEKDLSQFRVSLDPETNRLVFKNDPFEWSKWGRHDKTARGSSRPGTSGSGKEVLSRAARTDDARNWIAAKAPVKLRRGGVESDTSVHDSGLIVYVQEDVAYAMTPVKELGQELINWGMKALVGFVAVVGLLWYFVLHGQGSLRWGKYPSFTTSSPPAATPASSRGTVPGKTLDKGAAGDE
ncbi:MAG: protein kinase [Pirellulaceae bacterium]